MAEPSSLSNQPKLTLKTSPSSEPALPLESIGLRVKDGLLMAFSPDGDPIPPGLVKQACADDPEGRLRLKGGKIIDRERAIAVFDAQKRGPLSKRPNNPWIASMLGLAGGYEQTPEDLLASEPDTPLPPLPEISEFLEES